MGFFRWIIDKIAAMRQRAKAKKDLISSILQAAARGVFTPQEMASFQTKFKELELQPTDLKTVQPKAYELALRAATIDGVITPEGYANLANIETFLRIPGNAITESKKQVARLHLLYEIQHGNVPNISVQDLILQKNETAHWSEAASLLEERVVNRRYVGSSQGVSIRIAKGVTYRVGSQRGHLVSDTAVVPVSTGALVVTNKRLIFRGDKKSFNFRLDKLLDCHFYSDGVRVTDDKGKPRVIRFYSAANTDIVGAVLTHAVNHFAT
jgi:hypothetical protein